jgi:membrane associated rhomboid family serine protease
MMEDRDYMREPAYRGRLSLTIWLVIVNAAAFVLQNLAYLAFPRFPTDALFALSVPGLERGFLWRLITFQCMHGGLWHLLLNCFAIYMFGRDVEEALGRRRFLALYFTSGIIGGLFQILAAILLPRHLGGAVVGASAGAFGLTAAFAVLYPNRPLTLLLFFVLPLTLRAKFLLLISGLLALFGLLFPVDNVAHAAHLGGMLTGIAFVRWVSQWGWPKIQHPFRQRAQPVLVATRAQKESPWRVTRAGPADELSPDEFLSKEVDPILDKISAHGIHSLTERERTILEAARERIARR